MTRGNGSAPGELWNQAPEDWATLLEPMHRPLWQAMLDAAGAGPGARLLDVGCGGGGASVLAAERGALVSGIDAAAGMVRIAGARVPAGSFRVGTMEALPYSDAAFEVVFAANVIQFASDWAAALREWGRVCRPGGRIVAGLFGPPERVAFSQVFAAVREALPDQPPHAGPFALSRPNQLEALFTEAGWNVLQSQEVDCPYDFPDFDRFWQAQASAGPFQSALRAAGRARLRQAVQAAIEPYRARDGSIHLRPNVFKYVAASL